MKLMVNAGIAAALFAVVSVGCSKPAQPNAVGGGAAKPAAEGSQPSGNGTITIKGSDTMVNLVNAWAEAYMDANPGKDISVTGGGSGTGIAALINGSTDICMSSRDIKPEEAEKAKAAGNGYTEENVAWDGLAVVVNPKNPTTELTLAQVGQLFTGEAANWTAVGGPDHKVQVVSRESSSGTFVFFQEHVLNKKNYSADAMLLPATSAIVQTIGSDEFSIGYVGLGYEEHARDTIKAIGVKKDDASPAVLPSVATVKDGSYPIARKLFFYVSDKAAPIAKEFTQFCKSEAGQKIVLEEGYVPIH